MSNAPEPYSVDYPAVGKRLDGVFTTLLQRLEGEFPFDRTSLKTLPTGKRLTLWFRSGARRMFHVTIIRKGARYVVEMSGGDPSKVLRAVQICRDHFDRWFEVTPRDVRVYEAAGHVNNPVAASRAREGQVDGTVRTKPAQRFYSAPESSDVRFELQGLQKKARQ